MRLRAILLAFILTTPALAETIEHPLGGIRCKTIELLKASAERLYVEIHERGNCEIMAPGKVTIDRTTKGYLCLRKESEHVCMWSRDVL
jgi:hypothetical protein